MEHRWGARVLIDVPVRLDAGPERLALGMIRDVSLSGAYLETAAKLPPSTPVFVELDGVLLGLSEPYRLLAYVIRGDRRGLALEWSEFAPAPVRTLIARARRQRLFTGDAAPSPPTTLNSFPAPPVFTPYLIGGPR